MQTSNDFEISIVDHFQSPYKDIYLNNYQNTLPEELNLDGEFKLSHITIEDLNSTNQSEFINYKNLESINIDLEINNNNFIVGDKENNNFFSNSTTSLNN